MGIDKGKLFNIAREHGIEKLVFIQKGDVYCIANGEDAYKNRSFIVGKDEIYLGIYRNKELLIASFFHELGHIAGMTGDVLNDEYQAWINGFNLAEKHGYKLGLKSRGFANKCLTTYNHPGSIEPSEESIAGMPKSSLHFA